MHYDTSHVDRRSRARGLLLGLAVALALPTMAAAQTPQIPDGRASDQANTMVTLHSQGAAHRATHRRGDVVRIAPTRGPNAATRAIRATPATPWHGAGPAHKGGQSGSHRP